MNALTMKTYISRIQYTLIYKNGEFFHGGSTFLFIEQALTPQSYEIGKDLEFITQIYLNKMKRILM